MATTLSFASQYARYLAQMAERVGRRKLWCDDPVTYCPHTLP
jgi:hypothetical protein